jgi:peptide-methionine (S)-S-oxide reductase
MHILSKIIFLTIIFFNYNLFAINGQEHDTNKQQMNENKLETAILAGGCFWGVEELFSRLAGVKNVVNGYIGGNIDNPTYELISSSLTNHAEAVKISYDPKVISYSEILKYFFQIHDPTTINQQGNDIGTQYRSAIFYQNQDQKLKAQEIIKEANSSGVFPNKIITKLEKASKFYLAEDYHQDYLQKKPSGYNCHRIRTEWKF